MSPTWFSDMEGAFETAKCPVAPAAAGSGDKPQGKCLSQVISSKPNVWMRTPYPVTLVGDITWDDYTVGTEPCSPPPSGRTARTTTTTPGSP